MLCEFQKVTLIRLLNETKAWEIKVKFAAVIFKAELALGTNLHLIICAGNFTFVQGHLARMVVFILQK